MPYKPFRIKLLPAELIIKNFVYGLENCNYEEYLLEFINRSKYFLEKSNGKTYTAPESESHSECDCNSPDYKMDFKLLASKTMLQGRSICSFGKSSTADGVALIHEPKKKGASIRSTYIHVALRDYSLEQLEQLKEHKTKKQGIENDIWEILDTMETEKNLFLFFPFCFFLDDKNYNYSTDTEQLSKMIYADFQNVLQYRHYHAPVFETYFSFLYNRKMIIMRLDSDHFSVIDCLELTSSSIFQNILSYCDAFDLSL